MRNIRGNLYNFAEVYPDEGEMDFLKIMRILRDVQFSLSLEGSPKFYEPAA